MHDFRFTEKQLSQIPALRGLLSRESHLAIASHSLILALPVQ